MPEYLTPGVYMEEVSFRSRTIEGVPTSTTGFVGMARYGPVHYMLENGVTNGPSGTEPRLVTSYREFERALGGAEPLFIGGESRDGYLAHSARAFFTNGGSRLYIARVFKPTTANNGVAMRRIQVNGRIATWRARWPGSYGNALVTVTVRRSKNVVYSKVIRGGAGHADTKVLQVQGAQAGTVIEITTPPNRAPADEAAVDPKDLAVVLVDANGMQTYATTNSVLPALPAGATAKIVDLTVTVNAGPDAVSTYTGLGAHPAHRQYIARILDKDRPADEDAVVWLDWTPPTTVPTDSDQTLGALDLVKALQTNPEPRLADGNDGELVDVTLLTGKESDADDPTKKATGLCALAEVTDIAIVAAPDAATLGDDLIDDAADALIQHAETTRFRIAIIDPPRHCSLSRVREFRGRLDSTHAALYHPWIEVVDPTQPSIPGAPAPTVVLPPCGFVAGIYGRSDATRGVGKAPANEVVRGLSGFEQNINAGRQAVLNPEGINALRVLPGRGSRVWGARTCSSDPEWKYVNVRRLFNYLENSIQRATQWAVFEPNSERLWDNVRTAVTDFLYVEWVNGSLAGTSPEDAFFVRCDRTTMTQNDFDNGRMICLIGVAPVMPAEFVIFRVGQITAGAAAA